MIRKTTMMLDKATEKFADSGVEVFGVGVAGGIWAWIGTNSTQITTLCAVVGMALGAASFYLRHFRKGKKKDD